MSKLFTIKKRSKSLEDYIYNLLNTFDKKKEHTSVFALSRVVYCYFFQDKKSKRFLSTLNKMKVEDLYCSTSQVYTRPEHEVLENMKDCSVLEREAINIVRIYNFLDYGDINIAQELLKELNTQNKFILLHKSFLSFKISIVRELDELRDNECYFSELLDSYGEVSMPKVDFLSNIGYYYFSLNRHELSHNYFEKALSSARLFPKRILSNNIYFMYALSSGAIKKRGITEESYHEAISFLKDFDMKGDTLSSCYDSYGAYWESNNEYDLAKNYYEKSIYVIKNIDRKNSDLAEMYLSICKFFEKYEKYDLVKDYYEKAISLLIKVELKVSRLSDFHSMYADFIIKHDEYNLAKKHYDRAFFLCEKRRIDRDFLCYLYYNCANKFIKYKQYDLAKEYYEKSIYINMEISSRFVDLSSSYRAIADCIDKIKNIEL